MSRTAGHGPSGPAGMACETGRPRTIAKSIIGSAPTRLCAATGRRRSRNCLHCDIRHLSICAALEEGELGCLEAIVTGINLSPGAVLFEEGDVVGHVYNVTSGAVRLYKLLQDGRRQITGFMLPGDFLGLSARHGYAYGAEAVTETALCRFPLDDLRTLFERFPNLERRLLAMTGDELVAAQDQMVLLGRKNPMERVASFLLMLSRRAGRGGGPESPVVLPMGRSDIADYLGLTVETVSRTFTRLTAEGAIALPESSRVILQNPLQLQKLAGGS